MEGYERMKAGMRLYRTVGSTEKSCTNLAPTYAAISPLFRDPVQVKQMLANDIAFYMGWLGHYVADAAQPLHDSMHHDGWNGPNPKEYTGDPTVVGSTIVFVQWSEWKLISEVVEDKGKRE
jgi:hypothetical protein